MYLLYTSKHSKVFKPINEVSSSDSQKFILVIGGELF